MSGCSVQEGICLEPCSPCIMSGSHGEGHWMEQRLKVEVKEIVQREVKKRELR